MIYEATSIADVGVDEAAVRAKHAKDLADLRFVAESFGGTCRVGGACAVGPMSRVQHVAELPDDVDRDRFETMLKHRRDL